MMIPMFLLLIGAQANATDQRLSRMTALYDQVCLQAFPDEQAVTALMTGRDARRLTAEEAKYTLKDDPGYGWQISDGDAKALLIIEEPPYHACSLRWPMPSGVGDLGDYRTIAERYETKAGGFSPLAPYDTDVGDIHVHAIGEQRTLPDGGKDSLFIYDQHVTDPKRRAAGETGTMLRFVHQFAAPGSH